MSEAARPRPFYLKSGPGAGGNGNSVPRVSNKTRPHDKWRDRRRDGGETGGETGGEMAARRRDGCETPAGWLRDGGETAASWLRDGGERDVGEMASGETAARRLRDVKTLF